MYTRRKNTQGDNTSTFVLLSNSLLLHKVFRISILWLAKLILGFTTGVQSLFFVNRLPRYMNSDTHSNVLVSIVITWQWIVLRPFNYSWLCLFAVRTLCYLRAACPLSAINQFPYHLVKPHRLHNGCLLLIIINKCAYREGVNYRVTFNLLHNFFKQCNKCKWAASIGSNERMPSPDTYRRRMEEGPPGLLPISAVNQSPGVPVVPILTANWELPHKFDNNFISLSGTLKLRKTAHRPSCQIE